MPAKSVRFTDVNESYSIPPTPSPTFSNATLSTSGPMTPPQPPSQLHSAYIYKPFTVAQEPNNTISIHPMLAFVSSPRFKINLSDARTMVPHLGLTPRILSDGATIPPTQSFTVMCNFLPWKMTIGPSSRKPDAIVTVADVLHGLYLALRLPVKSTEFETEPPHSQRNITEAYNSRCGRLGPGKGVEEELKKGVKRIDFLLERHRFLGFTPAGNHDSKEPVWMLCVSP
ncbi:hypothetical protein BDZ94DRAFT_1266625 [Collybia nuda]|uniref:DUF6699 domain-containing protein n=1 Tax=Collybia nuda TaxID=64659 RepID=A0A9P5XYY6_9AGAR|nr:hypothetical protein BDZ94DRAFT_1266625 [Collybia nuda]